MSRPSERRTSGRRQMAGGTQLKIGLHEDGVLLAEIAAELVDFSEWGLRVKTAAPVSIGCLVSIGSANSDQNRVGAKKRSAHVVHCASTSESSFRLGLVFQEFSAGKTRASGPEAKNADGEIDLYEVLQVSPNADLEMIQKVYRLLAQRYHPDNSDSGDEETFKQVLQAYRVLGNPTERASYDADYGVKQRQGRKVSNRSEAADGVDAERRQRQRVISLLYTKKMREPRQGGLTLRELEEMTDTPKEQLEFCFWYLGENGLVVRSDGSRYDITVKGVNWAEQSGDLDSQKHRLLKSREPGQAEAQGQPFNEWSDGMDQCAGQAS